MTRQEMVDELREIEGSYSYEITPQKQKRARFLAAELRKCKCRCCGIVYDNAKSRADFQGFCSAKCQHAKAKACGYKKHTHKSEFDALKRGGNVGSVFVIS